MSIKLKDTIYDLISNADKLDGYHRSDLFESIPTWISASGLSKNITVAGNSSNFYPVVISVSSSKSMPTYISIYKDLGTTTPSLDGNHSNGTSSLWLRYEMRNTMWDGNGGYIKTLYKYQGYATLVAHTRTNTLGTGSLIVWLRGGTCAYTISCTNTFTVDIYYSNTNITGSSTYPDNVAPMTTVDNGGIYSTAYVGYGDLSGNASTASKLKTARTISLTGAITGTGTFDGSDNLSITTSVNHTHNYASTIKIGTSTTEYKCTDNTITLPAYPTLSSLGASPEHTHPYLSLSGGTLTGDFAANSETKTPYSLTTKLNHVRKNLNWSNGIENSYIEHVIPLIPVPTAKNWIGINYIDGKFLMWKKGGNVYDVVEVNLNCVYNVLYYTFTCSGNHSGSYGLCIVKYNGVNYYAIDCPYHANPYTDVEFYGSIKSTLPGGTSSVALPLDIEYYNANTKTVLNSEVYNSKTTTLTTSVITTATVCSLRSVGGFSGKLIGNADSASKLANARTVSLTGAITGSGTFDGSSNLTITTTTNHTHSYLPLSGGTIEGTLNIKRDAAAICYQNSSGTTLGWLGITSSGVGTLWESNGSTKHTLLHSGNSSVSKSEETLTVKINGTTQSLTNTNTWRGITDSYSGTATDTSLSQKGGKALYDALVNGYASSAGNADTVDNLHASDLVRKEQETRFSPPDGTNYYIKVATVSQRSAYNGGTFILNVSTRYHRNFDIVIHIETATPAYGTSTFEAYVADNTTDYPGVYYVKTTGNSTTTYDSYDIYVYSSSWGSLYYKATTAYNITYSLSNSKVTSLPSGYVTISKTNIATDADTVDGKHASDFASTVKVGNTSYTCSSNVISLPAYPTIPTIPTSLKNPYSLTIKGNGTELGKYDGSAAKTIDITPASIGAATSEHTHDRVKTVAPSGSASGWYRVGTISTSNAGYSQNVIISLQRSYYSPENEHYIFAISIGYNGYISITQLSGIGAYINKNGRLIEKVRIVWNNTGNCYFDYYMKSGSYNNGYKVTVLAGDFTTLQDIVLVTSAGGSVTEFTTTNGCKSNYGFTGDLTGNATTATTASKLAVSRTISLTGAITGSGEFDGSENLTISTSVNHTHSYAGSAEAGGAATSANKLNTNAGGTTTPVYFTGGVPTNCSVASTTSTASTIAVRDGSGDIYARLIRQTYADQSTISGGIVYRVNNSTDNYLRVCNSASAIRTFLGVPSSSDLSSYLPRQRMTNPDPGHASVGTIPLIVALKSAGTPLYGDPEFKDGVNSCYVYNNSGNSTVTVTQITDNQNSGNSSGKILQISTTTGTASPGRGGFYQTMNSRAGAVFCQIFRAKIPTGFTLANNENSMGSGYKTYWMTNKAGTGKWEWYCRITICGTSGTFGSGGHISLASDAGGNVAVTWYLSYCNVIDLTKGNKDGLRSVYADQADKLGSNAGSATQPVYFSGGKPVACTAYSGASVNYATSSGNADTVDGKHASDFASTVKVGNTPYTCSSNVISLPAYPTVPTSLKCPNSLTIQGNGTSLGSYDGSTAKTINITHSNIGAAPESHSHTFASLTEKPTTISGFGITDAYTPAKYNTTASHSGYYKIKINSTEYWMMGFRVRVYKSYKYFDIRFSGYNYGPNYWHSPVASLVEGDTSITVYFGYDSAFNLWVGIPAGNYTGIEITDAVNGYNAHGKGLRLDSLFTITQVSSLGGTTQSTQTIQPPSKSGHTHTKSQITDFNHDHSQYYDSGISRTANTVLAAPNGSAGTATFRKLVADDLPSHPHNYAGSSSPGGAANNSIKWGGYNIVVGSTGTDANTIYIIT